MLSLPALSASPVSSHELTRWLCVVALIGIPACGEPGDDTEASTGDDSDSADAPTWHQDVAPIITGRCQGCHVEGGIAPFALSSYETTKILAPAVAAAVANGSMPPFGARETDECQPPHPWKDDIRLDDEQIAILRAWSDAGAPPGDPDTAALLPEPADLNLAGATTHLTIPTAVTVDGTQDRFSCFSVPTDLSTARFVTGTQVRPGNDAIVHHVLVYVDTNGSSADLAGDDGEYDCFGGPGIDDAALLAAWAPGGSPFTTPPGVGIEVPAGARLVINVHYHPTGMGPEVDDATTLDIKWGDTSEITHVGELALVGNFDGPIDEGGLHSTPGEVGPPEFRIPANVNDHVEYMTYTVPNAGAPEYIVWAVANHMHYVGTDMRLTVTDPGGVETCLLQTPDWDFNWQRGYAYDASLAELPRIRPGDTLGMRCTYDNSLDNPFVREALAEQGLTEPHDVFLGEETLDEMCLGVFGIAVPR